MARLRAAQRQVSREFIDSVRERMAQRHMAQADLAKAIGVSGVLRSHSRGPRCGFGRGLSMRGDTAHQRRGMRSDTSRCCGCASSREPLGCLTLPVAAIPPPAPATQLPGAVQTDWEEDGMTERVPPWLTWTSYRAAPRVTLLLEFTLGDEAATQSHTQSAAPRSEES